MSKGERVRFEGLLEPEEAAEYLESIARGIRTGTLSLRHGADAVTLRPRPMLSLELEAKQSKDKEKVELEIKWKRAPGRAGEAELDIEPGERESRNE